jgi:hypothetical protein
MQVGQDRSWQQNFPGIGLQAADLLKSQQTLYRILIAAW